MPFRGLPMRSFFQDLDYFCSVNDCLFIAGGGMPCGVLGIEVLHYEYIVVVEKGAEIRSVLFNAGNDRRYVNVAN